MHRTDLDWLIEAAGYYIVESTSEDGRRSVYRLYHEALAEHLRAEADMTQPLIRPLSWTPLLVMRHALTTATPTGTKPTRIPGPTSPLMPPEPTGSTR